MCSAIFLVFHLGASWPKPAAAYLSSLTLHRVSSGKRRNWKFAIFIKSENVVHGEAM